MEGKRSEWGGKGGGKGGPRGTPRQATRRADTGEECCVTKHSFLKQ